MTCGVYAPGSRDPLALRLVYIWRDLDSRGQTTPNQLDLWSATIRRALFHTKHGSGDQG